MGNYATPTHQNIAVWCRRLGVEEINLDRAAEMADRIYGGPGRRGQLFVVCAKRLGVIHGISLGDTGLQAAAQAAALSIYESVYGKNRTVVIQYPVMYTASVSKIIKDGLEARKADHTNPNIVNAVLGKVRH